MAFEIVSNDPEVKSKEMLEEAARLIILALHEDPNREGLKDTPRRFRDMFLEDFSKNGTPEQALEEMVINESYDQMVIVRDIFVRSHCEHHVLPWWGRAAVGYIPNKKMIGLSKITRMVEAAARGLTIQERVTQSLADAMNTVLDPIGVMVVIEGVHACTIMRGVKVEAQTFTTSAAKGVFLQKSIKGFAARQEFLMLFSRNSQIL